MASEPGPPGEGRPPRHRGAFLSNRCPPEGPCYLLVRRADGEPWGNPNPFKVARILDAVLGPGGTITARVIRSGSLLVQAQSGAHASRLMDIETFLGHSAKAILADKMNGVEGVISCDSLTEMTEEELLTELQDQGVVGVYRLPSRDPAYPNPTVKLTFQGQTLPAGIKCGYTVVGVSPWVPSRPRCSWCWNYGHQARFCRQKQPQCGKCAAHGHQHKECPSPAEYMACPVCDGSHMAWDRRCEFVREERRDHRLAQRAAAAQHRQQATTSASWPAPSEGIQPVPAQPRGRDKPSWQAPQRPQPPSPPGPAAQPSPPAGQPSAAAAASSHAGPRRSPDVQRPAPASSTTSHTTNLTSLQSAPLSAASSPDSHHTIIPNDLVFDSDDDRPHTPQPDRSRSRSPSSSYLDY